MGWPPVILSIFAEKENDYGKSRLHAACHRSGESGRRKGKYYQCRELYDAASACMKELLEQAKGHIWICKTKDERVARELERKYHVSSEQYVGDELQMKFISEAQPQMECSSCEATLEDAYIYIANDMGSFM